jgi:hypothetical protein
MSHGYSVQRALPYVRYGLQEAMRASEAPTPRRAVRTFHGRHAVIRPQELPQDDLILEVRRLYEQVCLPPLAIHTYIAHLGHIRSLGWVRQTTQYHNRAHLVPAPNAAPYIATPTDEGDTP